MITINHRSGDMSRIKAIKVFLEKLNEPPFRYNQVIHAIYQQYYLDFNNISTLPAYLRKKLCNEFGNNILTIKPLEWKKTSQAEKVLFTLQDNNRIETARLSYKKGSVALCISSQVGCSCKCLLCATGAIQFIRDLNPDEITDQVLFFKHQDKNIDSIAFHGMGEPLLNPSIFDALKYLTDPKFCNISHRAISISTVGIIPGIERITKDFGQINLAYSLHSPFEEQRSKLIPMSKKYPIQSVLKALDKHILKTHRKIFISYVVLSGINDSIEHVEKIADLFYKRNKLSYLYHINLLTYNPTQKLSKKYETKKNSLSEFAQMLKNKGLSVTVRQSFGQDISAACGQFYAQYTK